MRLTLAGVGHRYPDGPWLFRDVDLEVGPGETVAVTGPSGTGKSTLLSIIGGALSATEGAVERAAIPRVARVRQTAYGVARRTAGDHIAQPYLARGHARDEAVARSARLADRFHLAHLVTAPYAQLSGGEAQRLMLARALAQEPDLILADEPTASLDAANAETVIAVLDELSSNGAIVIVATHDPRASAACDRQLVLR